MCNKARLPPIVLTPSLLATVVCGVLLLLLVVLVVVLLLRVAAVIEVWTSAGDAAEQTNLNSAGHFLAIATVTMDAARGIIL
jgi:hypothetical protein